MACFHFIIRCCLLLMQHLVSAADRTALAPLVTILCCFFTFILSSCRCDTSGTTAYTRTSPTLKYIASGIQTTYMQNPAIASVLWDTNEPSRETTGQCGVITPAFGGKDGFIANRWLMHDGPSS